MITAILIASVIINIIFLFYSRWLIDIVKTKEDDMKSLSSMIDQYVNHVRSIHDMEMFYGDQTLGSLMEHGREIVSTIEGLDFLLSADDEDQIEIEEGEQE